MRVRDFTTLSVDSAEQAAEILRWYGLRWRIEDWHRVLKSGCKIGELGHHSAERLELAIAIRMVIAWRVMLMTLLAAKNSRKVISGAYPILTQTKE